MKKFFETSDFLSEVSGRLFYASELTFDMLDVNSYVSKSLSEVSGRLFYASELTFDMLDVNSCVSKSFLLKFRKLQLDRL